MEAPNTLESAALAPVEPDWNAIRDRYLDGEELADIANDYGISPNAISCKAYRNGWKEQQLRLLLKDEALLSKEIRGCLLVSVLKESRMYQREDPPKEASARDLLSRCRERLASTADKLLGWSIDPLTNAKPAKCRDI